MFARLFVGIPLAVAALAVLWSWQASSEAQSKEPLPGRNNTVLFLTSDMMGLSNVHLATMFALLEQHPSVEVHYASFGGMEEPVLRVAAAAKAKTEARDPSSSAGGPAVQFHRLPEPSLLSSVHRYFGGWAGLVGKPGVREIRKKINDVAALVTTWSVEEHWALVEAMRGVIDEIDPAVVVYDHIFRPAVDTINNVDRRSMSISPNTLVDLVPDRQPWGAMFWKYPALTSGYPFPVPWHLIPSNIYLQLRIAIGILSNPKIQTMRKYLKGKGLRNPMPSGIYVQGPPLLAATLPEANLPVEFVPPEITVCGPIVLDRAPAAQQDSELTGWLAREDRKSILINFGTLFHSTRDRTSAMVGAVGKVLEAAEDAQVLWKFRPDPMEEVDVDEVLAPLRKYVDEGRLRVQRWLEVDPMSLLQTGAVDVFVHHGGGNTYHEAVLAGVPQVILPLWFDLYLLATTAEYLGIGIWPGKETAPEWDAETLSAGMLRALVGEEAASLKAKARALSEVARSYGGRDMAAREVARIAGLGEAR